MAEERVQRRLVAILAADVVSYSRLMGEDETGRLAALTAHRIELVEPSIASGNGFGADVAIPFIPDEVGIGGIVILPSAPIGRARFGPARSEA